LTWDGSLAAFGIGLIIGVFGDITWLALLLLFLITSFAATKYRFALKEAMGVQEGVRGERGSTNVLANGLAPGVIALFSFLNNPSLPKGLGGLLFVSAISVAAADTLASEIGVLSSKTFRITTLQEVPAGTNGGISILGQLAAIAAALYTSFVGWLVLYWIPSFLGIAPTMPQDSSTLLIPILVGFLGCQIDSLFGATLEDRGLLSKKTNNLLSTTIGAIVAYVLFLSI